MIMLPYLIITLIILAVCIPLCLYVNKLNNRKQFERRKNTILPHLSRMIKYAENYIDYPYLCIVLNDLNIKNIRNIKDCLKDAIEYDIPDVRKRYGYQNSSYWFDDNHRYMYGIPVRILVLKELLEIYSK